MAKKEISLGKDFGDVTVTVNGVSVDIHADGSIVAHTNGDVRTRAVPVDPVAAELQKLLAGMPKPGARSEDGTVWAGRSPEADWAMYTTPVDAPGLYTADEAKAYAANLKAHGHGDWRPPSKAELKEMFNHHAAIGGFDTHPDSIYWTGTPMTKHTHWVQRFSDGEQGGNGNDDKAALRLIRIPKH
jgi:hypothetical protein